MAQTSTLSFPADTKLFAGVLMSRLRVCASAGWLPVAVEELAGGAKGRSQTKAAASMLSTIAAGSACDASDSYPQSSYIAIATSKVIATLNQPLLETSFITV